jgi:RimJ/RimL family protein N-acetyltransferase
VTDSDHSAAPTLETDRLILRVHRRDDFAASAAMWADAEVVRFIGGTPFSAEASWARLLRYAGLWPMLGYGYWVVETKADRRFIGEVGFADFKREITPPMPLAPEAGWAFCPTAHGQGYASEATACIFAWGDRALAAPETFCLLDTQNGASVRIARKCGFAKHGVVELRGHASAVMRRRRPENTGGARTD